MKFNKLKESHLEQVRMWRMKSEITKFMYTDPIITKESQINWFKSINGDDNNKNWVVSIDNVNVAFVNLKIDKINKRGFWAYYIGELDYMGKGIGKQIELNILSYVFDILNLNKLTCEVFEFNDKVVKIHQKYGSKIEGILSEHIFKNEIFYNVVVMGILKNDYEQIKKNFDIVYADFEL